MFDPDDLRAICATALAERLEAGREPIGDPPPDDDDEDDEDDEDDDEE